MTISLSSLVAVVWFAADAGYVPVPATRDYVDSIVTDATKGLDYLVRQAYEKDLDNMRYDVECMQRTQLRGALARLEDEFETVLGVRYVHKSCDELEARHLRQAQ